MYKFIILQNKQICVFLNYKFTIEKIYAKLKKSITVHYYICI